MPRSSLGYLGCLLVGGIWLTAGCSVVNSSRYQFPSGDEMPLLAGQPPATDAAAGSAKSSAEAAAAEAVPAGPNFTVVLQPDQGRPQRTIQPLDDALTISSALGRCGALKAFRRCDLVLYRASPEGRRKIPMEGAIDRGTRQVNPEYDYAIYPNDMIVVVEDPSNTLDDMLQTLPTSAFLRVKRR